MSVVFKHKVSNIASAVRHSIIGYGTKMLTLHIRDLNKDEFLQAIKFSMMRGNHVSRISNWLSQLQAKWYEFLIRCGSIVTNSLFFIARSLKARPEAFWKRMSPSMFCPFFFWHIFTLVSEEWSVPSYTLTMETEGFAQQSLKFYHNGRLHKTTIGKLLQSHRRNNLKFCWLCGIFTEINLSFCHIRGLKVTFDIGSLFYVQHCTSLTYIHLTECW